MNAIGTNFRSWKKLILLTGFFVLLAGCDQAPSDSKEAIAEDKSSTPAATNNPSAQDLGARAAAWQLAHMDNFDYVAEVNREQTADPREWIQAAFYIGLTRWTEAADDESLVAAIAATARDNGFQLGDRPMHGDDHAIGQTYLWLYEQTGDEAVYSPTRDRFDAILADPPSIALEFIESTEPGYKSLCQVRWCWADALFMAPRTWLQLSNTTGDPRYFEYADREYWATVDYLFSREHGLFFRDSRYFERRSDNGSPVFWSRGNGWVFAGLALILDDLPPDHPSYERYLDLYRHMASSLVAIQKPDGYWPASLLDADKVKSPEVSGTGFVTFGLAWGLNNRVLDDEATIAAVDKGWAALAAAVDADGMVHWVQQVGRGPDPVRESDTQLYGVGAFLLAASEMTKR